jgi:hypothetical protein
MLFFMPNFIGLLFFKGIIMNLSIGSETQQSKAFELVIQVRDNKGNATGRTKSFYADNGNELEELWIKNNGVTKKRKRLKKSEEEVKPAKKKGIEE